LTSGDPDLADRFDVLVDTDADPVDVDEAVAEFVIRLITSTPAGASTADRSQEPEA